MNKLLFRFYLVKEDEYLEVYLDSRLSFKENFKLLKDIVSINLPDIYLYDKEKGVFLNKEVKLKEFNFSYFTCLYIFA